MCNQCPPGQRSAKHVMHAQAARKTDPTQTLTLRKKFERDLDKRFNQLKRLIVATLVTNDALGLKTNTEAAPSRAFAFGSSAQKTDGFMAWLRQQQDDLIFEVSQGTRRTVSGNHLWTDVYIDTAYQRGLASAASRLQGVGVSVSDNWLSSAFFRPVHADSIGLIYSRTYSDLRGITEAMDSQISRALAQGLAEGRASDSIARDLVDRVDKIGKARARVLARTEIVNAVSEASLNSYEEAGLEGVGLEAEFSTSGDEAVCAKCEALAAAGPYTIQQARGLIPAHPSCRCAWLPIVGAPRALTEQNIEAIAGGEPPRSLDTFEDFAQAYESDTLVQSWRSSWTEGEKEAIRSYIDSPQINNDLRAGRRLQSQEYLINGLDSAIRRAPVFTAPTTLFRTMNKGILSVGDEYIDPAYLSVSLAAFSQKIWRRYRDADDIEKMEIIVPAGTPRSLIERFPGEEELNMTEILLPRGSRFRVEGQKEDGTFIVRML